MKIKRNKKKIQKAGSKIQTIQNTILKPQKIWRLQLHQVEDSFIDFMKKNIYELKGDHPNQFLERVFEYIVLTPFYTNPLFDNTTWLRLFNLFTEEIIYINKRNELEPLPYSWMELEVFGFKDLYGENEDPKIGEFMEFFFLQNYDLERNPFFIGEEWIFEKLHTFYEYKERKPKWRGDSQKIGNQKGGKADVQRMIQLETLREDLDSVHDFMKTRTSSIPESIPKSVSINMSRKDLLFRRSENEIKKIKPRLNVKSNITCKESKNTYLSSRFHAGSEKKETKKKILKTFDINKYSSISTSSTDKFFIRYYNKSNQIAHSQFEYYYLKFLMANDDIGSNVFYFSYNNLLSSNYFLFVKQLLYNAIGRFEILINDASFFKSIITDMLSNSKNKNEVKSFRKKIEIYLIYRKNLLFKQNIVITKKKWGELNTKYSVKNKNKKNTILEINKENSEFQTKIRELNDEIQLWKDKIEDLKNQYLQTKDTSILDQIKVKLLDKKIILEKVKLKVTFENLLQLKQKLKFDIKPNNGSFGNYTYTSWGMEIDPSSITGYHVPLFSKSIYEKMFLEIFADLQLNGCQFQFIINIEDNPVVQPDVLLPELNNKKTQKIKSFTIKFTNPYISQQEMNRSIDKSSPSSNRTAKDTRILQEVTFEINNDLNEVNFINNVIILLIDKLYKKKLQATSLNKMNGIVNKMETSIPVSKTDVELQIKKVKGKEKILENFDKLIRILLNNQYTIQEITRFILRFKIMGDKLQGLEARYNCSILNDYSDQRMQFKEKDIYVKHRLMVTKDRPLMAFAQVENNINFLSQTTLNGEKVVYWNYGDAFSQMKDISDTDRQLDYLPVISTFTMNKLFGLNYSEIDFKIKKWRDIINQYFLFYKDQTQTSTPTVILHPFTGLPKKTKKIHPKPVVTTSQQSSGTVTWRGTLSKTPKKFKLIISKPTIPVS